LSKCGPNCFLVSGFTIGEKAGNGDPLATPDTASATVRPIAHGITGIGMPVISHLIPARHGVEQTSVFLPKRPLLIQFQSRNLYIL